LPEAALLVVGSRGRSGGPVFGLGTVSRHLLKATACPVVVVPDRMKEPVVRPGAVAGPVVAGVDGGALAVPVLVAAADEAAAHGAPVLAVHAYRARPGEDDETAAARARSRVMRLVHEAQHAPDVPPGVEFAPVVTTQAVAPALLQRATGATALVLATRGPGALAGLAIESVSRAVLDAATCPVLLLVPRSARRSARVPRPRSEEQERAGT
jgi:nucleotide-binding universal stress UspA family protein